MKGSAVEGGKHCIPLAPESVSAAGILRPAHRQTSLGAGLSPMKKLMPDLQASLPLSGSPLCVPPPLQTSEF